MRQGPWLALSVATASGHSAISNQHRFGICSSPSWRSNSLFVDLGVCARDGLVTQDDGVDYETQRNGSVWTFASPCYGEGDDEYCTFSSPDFANGRGISIVTTRKRADYLANLPAFTDPDRIRELNQDLVETTYKNYKVVPIPGKGMGIVATRALNRGDLIMSNTFSMAVDYGAFEKLPREEILRLQTAATDYLPSQHRSHFLNLSTHDDIDGYDLRIEKVLATNAFDIVVEDEHDFDLYMVFAESKHHLKCRYTIHK